MPFYIQQPKPKKWLIIRFHWKYNFFCKVILILILTNEDDKFIK